VKLVNASPFLLQLERVSTGATDSFSIAGDAVRQSQNAIWIPPGNQVALTWTSAFGGSWSVPNNVQSRRILGVSNGSYVFCPACDASSNKVTVSVAANTAYAWKFSIDTATRWSPAASIDVVAVGTGSQAFAGLYHDDSSNALGHKFGDIICGGTANITAVGSRALTFTLGTPSPVLAPGDYWYAFEANGTASIRGYTSSKITHGLLTRVGVTNQFGFILTSSPFSPTGRPAGQNWAAPNTTNAVPALNLVSTVFSVGS
jgi:hypothetical protein